MVCFTEIFDRKWFFFFLVSVVFSLLTLLFLPAILQRFSFASHVTFQYYVRQLMFIIPFLPIGLFLFSIISLRKFLDYSRIINNSSTRSFLLLVFFLSLVATNLISYFFYNHSPQGDAVVTTFQAKIFAGGYLWVQPPQFPQFFLKEMIVHSERWFSMVQHGHSFLLTPFLLLRIPWFLGPLLGSCSLLLFFFFMRECTDERSAREGTLLLLLSPIFLLISASYLNQNSSFFLILLGLLFFSLSIKRSNHLFPFLSGLFCGLAFFSRTTVVVFVLPMIVMMVLTKRKKAGQTIIFFLAGLIPALSIQFFHNLIYTGNIFQFGYALHGDHQLHRLGFGMGIGESTYGIAGHTPVKAIINLCYNAFSFSLHLFGWPLISLFFIPFAFLRRKRTLWDIFAITVIVFAIIFFAFYWFHGISPMGAKYYYGILPLLILLTVRGIKKTAVRPLVSILVIFNIACYIPYSLRIFHQEWGTNNRCYHEIKKMSVHHALVFIQNLPGSNEYEITINRHNYLSVAFRNEPILKQGTIIYARDLGETQNMQLMREFRKRKPYIFKYYAGGRTWRLQPFVNHTAETETK